MRMDRRGFIKALGLAGLGGPLTNGKRTLVGAAEEGAADRRMGVLVDIPNCIGCRKCEFACGEAAGFDVPSIDTFDDKSVFSRLRRPDPRSLTVLNQFPNSGDAAKPLFVKANCLHCNEPACASACLVGALRKEDNGAVVYDAWKCMGCRYCMIACPFQIPAYEYDNAFTPQVRKCNFCFDRISQEGSVPACVKICPRECLTFGPRERLLEHARQKIADHPDLYVNHVYGEHEAGGTSWLYLSSVPFEPLGFVTLPDTVPERLTETIQHAIFKGWVPPIAFYVLLGLAMWMSRESQDAEQVAEAGGAAFGLPASPSTAGGGGHG